MEEVLRSRSNTVYVWVVIVTMHWITSVSARAETRRPLTPEACTSIRYLTPETFTSLPPLKLSPDGKDIAYILQVPDEAANDNKDDLYVRSVSGESTEEPLLLLASDLIVAVDRFADNRHLAVLMRHNGKVVLAQVDAVTKGLEIIWSAQGDITDYSMDAQADTIVVAVRVQGENATTPAVSRDDRKGYRIDLATVTHPGIPKREINVLRKVDQHHWTLARRLSFVSPLSGRVIDSVEDAHDMHVSISPNGRYLV